MHRTPSPLVLVVTCEHGGHEVPAAYAPFFKGQRQLLHSHRSWDAGALELAQHMASQLVAPLYAAHTTRLLIDLNRSLGHRQLFSDITRHLKREQRQAIVDVHYRPYRDQVETAIAAHIASGRRVLHVAAHSFTPVLHGVLRRADVAWLYDPRRAGEVSLARQWLLALGQHAPQLRLRRNYPYQGRGDGLTALLRKRFTDAAYIGLELEVNQRLVLAGGTGWAALQRQLMETLRQTLTTWPPAMPSRA